MRYRNDLDVLNERTATLDRRARIRYYWARTFVLLRHWRNLTAMEKTTNFDPRRFLTKVGGADYLEVKWRLYWLRHDHPDATIQTDLMSHQNDVAVFRAQVSIPDGGSATGWGSEGYADFRDYLEKAETKALGRALAALGYGTQFTPEFEFGADRNKVVDSPVFPPGTSGKLIDEEEVPARRIAAINQPVTERQLKFINAIARDKGLTAEDVDAEVEQLFGKATIAEMDRRDASILIDSLQSREALAKAS
jgi:hypothetical protein